MPQSVQMKKLLPVCIACLALNCNHATQQVCSTKKIDQRLITTLQKEGRKVCMILFRDVCSTCPIVVFYPLQQKKSKQLLAGKTGSAHIMTKVDFPRQFRFPSGIVKLINCTKSTRNFICHKKNKRVFLYFLFGHVFDNHMIFQEIR